MKAMEALINNCHDVLCRHSKLRRTPTCLPLQGEVPL
jgi:hypothetical protein